ncbi:MAG: ABC transporter permease [Bdellovibrio sp.]|nr:MAG: ABC transporter permease [Bdellovibrio sp.]
MMDETGRPPAPKWAHVILLMVLFFLYFPLLYMIWGAFRTDEYWSFGYFVRVLANEYWMDALYRSLSMAWFSSVISTILGTAAALTLDESRTKGPKVLPALMTLAMVVPELVFALILLTWFSWLHFSLSLLTVLVAHVTYSVSFTFLIVYGRVQQLDRNLAEAAADLGASPWQGLLKVKIPLLRPAMGAAFFVAFLLSFDDFLISFYVNGVGTDLLPIKLYAAIKIGMTPELNALATILALISGTAVAILLRSRFIQGMISP